MVKNTQGGSKHKSFARKDNHHDEHIRLSQHHNECYAKVSKMLGNGMCLVDIILDNNIHTDIICHIRGKFRNKHKKNNMVSIQSILLVGIREWTKQLHACDLLFVYSHHHIHSLPISLFSIQQPLDDNISFIDNNNNTQHTNSFENKQLEQPLQQHEQDDDIDFTQI